MQSNPKNSSLPYRRILTYVPLAMGLYAGMAGLQSAEAAARKNWIGYTQSGIASFYKAGGMTMAHRTLPKGTWVAVTEQKKQGTGRSICVRVADRGPFIKGRIVDLSLPASRAIGLTKKRGIMRVSIRVVGACP
jgi:rare lipoprotein A